MVVPPSGRDSSKCGDFFIMRLKFDGLVKIPNIVIPAKAGIQNILK
jgi:hypothetical protein